MAMISRRTSAVVVACHVCFAVIATEARAQVSELSKLSLEDLLKVEVTTASRKEQPLSRTAAAVYVITSDDIERSGARTVPDLLRQVPGFEVGQIDAGSWAVTARGFNNLYANMLLVLVDGRSVYTPLFAGVNWDMLNVPLEDIQRVEVVRGPGGSLWGTNAVNGVVNIITKDAGDTRGGLVKAVLGGARASRALVRYGGGFGGGGHYRVYGQYDAAGTNRPTGGFADPDDRRAAGAGVRADWSRGIDRLVVTGAVQDGRTDHVRAKVLLTPPWSELALFRTNFSEGNATVRWTRVPSSRKDGQILASYSAYSREVEYGRGAALFTEDWQIGEIEARGRRQVARRHEIVAGLGYRTWHVHLTNTENIAFFPADQRTHSAAVFAQYELNAGRGVFATAGVKVERNTFTGVETQPNLRILWNPARSHTLWASASRAVRIPSITDRGVDLPAFAAPGPGGLPVVGRFLGAPETVSAVVYAYEAGYRAQAGRLFADFAWFTNQYDPLIGTRAEPPAFGIINGRPAIIAPIHVGNIDGGDAHGAELALTVAPTPSWRVSGSWTGFVFDPYVANSSQYTPSPVHKFTANSYLDLQRGGQLNVQAARVGAAGAVVPSYVSVRARLAWRFPWGLGAGITVENLGHHGIEFRDNTGFESGRVRPLVLGELSWRF